MKHIYFTFFLFGFLFGVNAQDTSTSFRIKIKTDSPNETFTIPTHVNETYDYSVKWRDNYRSGGLDIIVSFIDGYTGNATNTYREPGEYTISIKGNFPRIFFSNAGDTQKVLSIEQWGDNQWTNMTEAFNGCTNMVVNATDTPGLSLCTSLKGMFRECVSLEDNGNAIDDWNVSTIQDFREMFYAAVNFDQNLGKWDISNALSMDNMFQNVALSTSNYDATLTGWASLGINGNLKSNVVFNGGNSTYCASRLTRRFLTDPAEFNWTIIDGGEVCEEDKFITTWQTTIPNETITIPTTGSGYNYNVIWGDGLISKNITGNATHTYETPGIHQIEIYGDFPRIHFNNGGNKNNILSIEQWGNIQWTSMEAAFRGCTNLVINATDNPNLSNATSLANMFRDCFNLEGSNLSNWNVSTITKMNGMLLSADKFNGNISSWDVGSVDNFQFMFAGADIFNQDISGWKIGERVSGDISMERMFSFATTFNKPVEGWDMSKVTNLSQMFNGASKFNQSLSNWNVSNVTKMKGLFSGASIFNQSLGNWNIQSVSDMTNMLNNTDISVENYEATLLGWATLEAGEAQIPTNVTFSGGNSTYCDKSARNILTRAPKNWTITDGGQVCPEEEKFITTWTVTGGDLSIPIYMFGSSNDYTVDWGDGTIESDFTGDTTHTYATAGTYTVKIYGDFSQLYFFNRIGKEKIRSIEQWGTNKWTGLDFSFYGCSNLELNADDVPDLSQATSIGFMFQNASSLTDAKDKLKDWNVSTIKEFNGAFQGASSFNRNISGWNMQAAENISLMFAQNSAFNQPIGTWVFNNLTQCEGVFWGATSFNQNLSNWDVSKVEIFSIMFKGATAFDQSLASWDISAVNGINGSFGMDNMFENAGLSTDNYDATLFGWATLDAGETQIPSDITFHGGNSNYCVGASVRQSLINNFKWIITDGDIVCDEEDKFISTWKTTSNNESIQIRTTGGGSSFAIDWGDGTSTPEGGSKSHRYATPGTYTVKISGTIGQLYANNRPEADKMYTVEQWGASKWTSFRRAFSGADNVVINATDMPDLSNVTSFEDAFNNCKKLVDNGGQIKNWNVSNIENFTSAFKGSSLFDVDLGNWDLSSATNLGSMLNGTGLSVVNYDATLQGWVTNPNTPNDKALGASGLQYCFAEPAKIILELNKNWTINDAGLGCASADFFITTWQTTSANESITVPTTGSGYNYTVDWGDGSFETNITGNAAHEYTAPGSYKVKISGDFPRIYFNNTGDKDKIISIDQWGKQQWTSMERAFYGCANLESNASDAPDLSQATSLRYMFRGTSAFVDNEGAMNSWDTSTITDMSHMFVDSIFDFDITGWDVGNVTNFFRMFGGNTAFNQNISSWNIGEHVTGTIDMAAMFLGAEKFNQPIGNWDVSKVRSMDGMFSETKAFNQSLANWDVSKVSGFISMFEDAEAFDQSLGTWDISSAINMGDMFKNSALTTDNYDTTLIGWATLENTETQIPSGITLNLGTLQHCLGEVAKNKLTSTPYHWNIRDGGSSCTADYFITTWETTVANESIAIPTTGTGYNYVVDWGDGSFDSNVTGNATHTYTTAGTHTIKILGDFPRIYFNNTGDKDKIIAIEQWGRQQWTSMHSAFRGCTNLVLNADDTPDFSKPTLFNIHQMFQGATNLVDIKDKMNDWNVSNVQNMFATFAGCSEFNEDISSWQVGNVRTFLQTFVDASKFNQNISGWDTGSATIMATMFTRASAFNQDIGGWDVSKVQRMDNMFNAATEFNQDLSSWDISSLGTHPMQTLTAENMFKGATKFSNENYDKLLVGWARLDTGETSIPSNVILNANANTYCFGGNARNTLIATPYNWTITDGGMNCDFTNAFITTWQTTTANESITIPTTGIGYSYAVDWGDGTIEGGFTGNATHEYATAGIYMVKITGDFPRIFFHGTGDKDKIVAIDQWGAQEWTSMDKAFWGCINLEVKAPDAPDLSMVTSLRMMFRDCSSLDKNFKVDFSGWDISGVENFAFTFSAATAFNSSSISGWNVGNVSNFIYMFQGASAFNQDISNWNIGENVTGDINMFSMFITARDFNQPIGNWDVSKVSNAGMILRQCASFDQDLSQWDISNMTNMSDMFQNTKLSTENYDATLIGWATQEAGEEIPVGITFDGGNSNYCLGGEARNILTSTPYNWTITDAGIACDFTNAFITTWETTTANESIAIPTAGNGYNYIVDWGDGTIESGFTGNATHEYVTSGTHTVKILGNFPRIHFNSTGDQDKIKSIEQWGTQEWKSMEDAFRGCEFLEINATDSPNLSQVTNMSFMFTACKAIGAADFSSWDTSNVTNMSWMFYLSRFNGNISTWNVGKVTSFKSMFRSASRFNQDISQWNIGEFVTGFIDMSEMFKSASKFNQSLNTWDVSKVDRTHFMFQNAFKYNQPMDNWNVASVKFMNGMFDGARDFNQELSSWDISSVTTMVDMLTGTGITQENYDTTLIGWATLEAGEIGIPVNLRFDASATYCLAESARSSLISSPYNWTITDGGQNCDFTNAFIYTWQTNTANETITIPTASGSVYDYVVDWGDGTIKGYTREASHSYATPGVQTIKIIGQFPKIFFFGSDIRENLLTIEQWGTQQWTSMGSAFNGCINLKLNADDVPDLSLVTSLRGMFKGCTNLEDLKDKMNNWDVSKITSISQTFAECSLFNENIGDWEFTVLDNLSGTFKEATSFNQNIANWNVSTADDFSDTFSGATAFNQPIGNWTLGTVDYMDGFFRNATAFNQDLSGWDMSSVYDIHDMFEGASSFNQDLSAWDISKVEAFDDFFIGTVISQENYDKTLIGWATIEAGETAIPANLKLNADVTYCLSESARNTLASAPYNWTITDGGKDCNNTAIWSGANGTVWIDSGNWSSNNIPLTTNDIIIQDVTNQPVIGSGVVAEINDLTIETLADFDISDNGAVIVNGNLTTNETIGITSSVNTSGTLIVKGTANGNVTYERTGLVGNKWSIITAPVSGQSIKEFIENSTNGIRVNNTVTPKRYAVAYYDDTKAVGTKWTYYTADDIQTSSLTFEQGKGYIISRAMDGSVKFTGTLETEDVSVSVNADQWNSVGNPYTAYMPINTNGNANFIQANFDKFSSANVGVYIWDVTQNKYVAKTLVGDTSALTVGQGFFVKTTDGVSSINFKEVQRLSDPTDVKVFSRKEAYPSIQVQVTQGAITVDTNIKYMDNATEGLDPGYDVGNFGGAAFDVYTRLVSGINTQNFTLQSLPNANYESMVIPLGITSKAGEEVSITMNVDNLPVGVEVYLEDRKLGVETKLSDAKAVYNVTFKTKTEGIGRFFIHTKSASLNVPEVEVKYINIYTTTNKSVIIEDVNGEDFTVEIFNTLGSKVIEDNYKGAVKTSINVAELSSGAYIVKLVSEKQTITKKIIIE
ncbi:conserved protein of unknown function precursor containing a type A C-terminal secretion signal [Tenacibaculum sp. 190524A02b]|uniref:BspA family leucine-rich repeat surface protein n=1 Tax=Tenacibaculum vairaonense TaxID=3137860 RepID=UPI0032B25C8D